MTDTVDTLVGKFVRNRARFFRNLKVMTQGLQQRGHSVISVAGLNVAEKIINKEDPKSAREDAMSMFLRMNEHREVFEKRDVEFFRDNLSSIFNLPKILNEFAQGLFDCRDENGKLDISDADCDRMFAAIRSFVSNGLKILYLTCNPSGYSTNDELGYKVYQWRVSPLEALDFLDDETLEKFDVENLNLSEAIHDWKVTGLPHPQ